MVDNKLIEKIIQEVMASMSQRDEAPTEAALTRCISHLTGNKASQADYPLSETRADSLKTPTGKALSDITLENIMNGVVTADDVKIAPETLALQADVAESVNRSAFAANLKRAAELIAVPDARILEIYNAMRPYRSTKAELLAIADELEHDYGCVINSNLVREAAEVYERRGRLK